MNPNKRLIENCTEHTIIPNIEMNFTWFHIRGSPKEMSLKSGAVWKLKVFWLVTSWMFILSENGHTGKINSSTLNYCKWVVFHPLVSLGFLQGTHGPPLSPFWRNSQNPNHCSLPLIRSSFSHLWNQLPLSFQSHSSLQVFKTAVHHQLRSSPIENHDLLYPR